MLDQDAMSKREALAYAAGYESCQRDHAAEVKRMTAELAKSEEKSEARRKLSNARQDMVDCLTARVAELESGSAFVGEELRSRPERDEHRGFYWAQSSRGGPELELSHTDEASIPECHDWMRAFAYTGPTTAPLPAAGDEGKPCPGCQGKGEVIMSWPGMGDTATCPTCLGKKTAPAEPDSPAEERPSKLRDESWIREAADAEDQHASVCAGDMAPTKPDCLDGVPAVLCEYRNDYRPMGERWWVYGAVVDGRVAGVQDGKTGRPAIWHLMYLTPIDHDPTDAAAVELAGMIAEGGGK